MIVIVVVAGAVVGSFFLGQQMLECMSFRRCFVLCRENAFFLIYIIYEKTKNQLHFFLSLSFFFDAPKFLVWPNLTLKNVLHAHFCYHRSSLQRFNITFSHFRKRF